MKNLLSNLLSKRSVKKVVEKDYKPFRKVLVGYRDEVRDINSKAFREKNEDVYEESSIRLEVLEYLVERLP